MSQRLCKKLGFDEKPKTLQNFVRSSALLVGHEPIKEVRYRVWESQFPTVVAPLPLPLVVALLPSGLPLRPFAPFSLPGFVCELASRLSPSKGLLVSCYAR